MFDILIATFFLAIVVGPAMLAMNRFGHGRRH